MDTPWEAGGGAGPSALTPPEEWKGATGKDAQQDAQGWWGSVEGRRHRKQGAFGTTPHSQLIPNLHFQSTFLCLSSSSRLSHEFGGAGTRVTEDGGSERLSDFPQVTQPQNQALTSDLSWTMAHSTTPSEVRALLPVWGQVFFLLLLPGFLARLLLVESKPQAVVFCFLPPPPERPALFQPRPLVLPSEASWVSSPPCPRPASGSSAPDASDHPPGGRQGVCWGDQGLGRTGRRLRMKSGSGGPQGRSSPA